MPLLISFLRVAQTVVLGRKRPAERGIPKRNGFLPSLAFPSVSLALSEESTTHFAHRFNIPLARTTYLIIVFYPFVRNKSACADPSDGMLNGGAVWQMIIISFFEGMGSCLGS